MIQGDPTIKPKGFMPGAPLGGEVYPVQMIEFTILGKPKAWGRMREQGIYIPKTKRVFIRKFKEGEVVTNEAIIRMAFTDRMREEEGFLPWRGPVALHVGAYFPMIKGSKWWLRAARACVIPFIKVPDSDNLGKIVGDSLNEVAWADDKLITPVLVEKWYADKPRTEITIFLYPEIKAEFYDMAPKEEKTDESQETLFAVGETFL